MQKNAFIFDFSAGNQGDGLANPERDGGPALPGPGPERPESVRQHGRRGQGRQRVLEQEKGGMGPFNEGQQEQEV